MRTTIIATAAGPSLAGLPACVPLDTYNASAYHPTSTTTTTTVVRDGYGNPISTTQAVRDVNGNPVAAPLVPTYQYVPGHYQDMPGGQRALYQRE